MSDNNFTSWRIAIICITVVGILSILAIVIAILVIQLSNLQSCNSLNPQPQLTLASGKVVIPNISGTSQNQGYALGISDNGDTLVVGVPGALGAPGIVE